MKDIKGKFILLFILTEINLQYYTLKGNYVKDLASLTKSNLNVIFVLLLRLLASLSYYVTMGFGANSLIVCSTLILFTE